MYVCICMCMCMCMCMWMGYVYYVSVNAVLELATTMAAKQEVH
jgi:hypothetical protein